MNDPVVRYSHHVTRIAEAMAPDPQAWEYLTQGHGQSHCVCGQEIVWQFILLRPADGKRLVIGSTCILKTVPWLREMDAVELANALEQAWRAHLKQQRRATSHARFAEALAQATAQAFELDEWWRALQGRLEPYLHPPVANWRKRLILPNYWRKQLSANLRTSRDRATGEKAGTLRRRITALRSRIPLLESALARYGEQMGSGWSVWIQPPPARDFERLDDILPLIEQVDELRPAVTECFERYRLILSSVLDVREEQRLHRLHARPLRTAVRMLAEWIDLATQFVGMDKSRLEAALGGHQQALDEVAGLKGKLLGLNDSFAPVMDARHCETLTRLLRLWRDQRLATLTRWADEAKRFITSLDMQELAGRRAQMDALLLRADALRHVLTDIMNAPLTRDVLPNLVQRIRDLPLWDTPETLTQLQRQVAAFEGEIRAFPGEDPVRKKAHEPRFRTLQLNLEAETETLVALLRRAHVLVDAT